MQQLIYECELAYYVSKFVKKEKLNYFINTFI